MSRVLLYFAGFVAILFVVTLIGLLGGFAWLHRRFPSNRVFAAFANGGARPVLFAPLAVFLVIGTFAAIGLINPTDTVIRSRQVGKALPEFALPAALPGRASVNRTEFALGQPRILNIFASWCIPCIGEAPNLMALSQRGIPIDAIAIRDRPEDVAAFLQRYGDPYRNVASDVDSSLQMAIGSSGVPETFIIDGQGVIRYQHIGAVNATDIPRIVEQYEAARAPL